MRSRNEANEYVLKTAKEHDVKFIRLWFTDILGFLKSFAITVEELEGALEEGMGFDGSSIEGFTRIDESDMMALPEPETFQLLPWRPKEQNAVARMFCDIIKPEGAAFEGDPRFVLKRNLQRAADLGYTYYVGPELEYFYFKDKYSTEGLDEGGYFDMTPLDLATDLRRETVLTLEEMGIGVEYSHHEVAGSQHEIDVRYTDALTMADNVMKCVLRPQRRVLPVGDSPQLHRGSSETRPGIHCSHQPVGELLQAACPRIRSAGVSVVGSPQQG
jgi:glutamine synthetase